MEKHDEERTSRIWEKMEKARVAMVTLMTDGKLTSRPMTIQDIEEPGTIWFFTGHDTSLAQAIGSGAQANVAVSDHDESLYVSVAGQAAIVDDMDRKKELWNAFAKAWFPGGVDDPNLALLRVDIGSAEYWDSDHAKMTQMLMMAKAAVTGRPPTNIGEHGKLDAPRAS